MSFSEVSLEKKLIGLQPTQESIQTVALYILHFKDSAAVIVPTWMKSYRAAPSKHRLSLFYLINELVQTAKKKKLDEFRESFMPVIKESLMLIRTEASISGSFRRVLDIWREREIYDNDYLDQLYKILRPEGNGSSTPAAAQVSEKILSEFKPDNLVTDLERFSTLEGLLGKSQSRLTNMRTDFVTNLQNHSKDRQQCLMIMRQVDDEHIRCADFVEDFSHHVEDRARVTQLVEQAELFYETQLSEAKIVENAYKTFGSRIKSVRKKLEAMAEQMAMTPPRDAPSPSPLDDPFAYGVEAALKRTEPKVQEQMGPMDMDLDDEVSLSKPGTSESPSDFFDSPGKMRINSTRSFLAPDPRLTQKKSFVDGGGTPTQDESPSTAFNRSLDNFNAIAYGGTQTHYVPARPTGVSSLVNAHIHAASTTAQSDVYRPPPPALFGGNFQPNGPPPTQARLSFPAGNLNSTPRSSGSQDSLDAIQATIFDTAEVRSADYVEKYLKPGDSSRSGEPREKTDSSQNGKISDPTSKFPVEQPASDWAYLKNPPPAPMVTAYGQPPPTAFPPGFPPPPHMMPPRPPLMPNGDANFYPPQLPDFRSNFPPPSRPPGPPGFPPRHFQSPTNFGPPRPTIGRGRAALRGINPARGSW